MTSEYTEIRLSWAGATDQGHVRAQNQDAMYADADLFVVADGLGYPTGGEIAANLAVRALANRAPTTINDLLEAVTHANQVVHERSISQVELRGMGTTLCAMAVIQTENGRQIGLVNVGDSRAYRHQGGQLEQLTLDHNRVTEMVRFGLLTPAEAATHEQRHTLTRALGVAPSVDVDHWTLDIASGDRFLLCSDGVSNEVSDTEIASILGTQPDASDAARALVFSANEHGGSDNSTALVVDVTLAVNTPPADPTNEPTATLSAVADASEAHQSGTGSTVAGARRRRRWFRSRTQNQE